MKTIKGPAIFLAQFADDKPPFNRLSDISKWAAGLGYKGVQIPTWDARLFDLKRAAESRKYCDEILETLAAAGVQLTELSTHLQGQLVAVHPAYDAAFDGFAPESVRGNPVARQAWAVEQLLFAAKASANLGVKAHATFSGALAWPYVYPWPQRPQGLIETAFEELAKRWRPILDAFDAAGVDLCFELHPGEDLHDGVTFDRFLDCLGGHNRCNILYDPSHFVLQQLDYLAFLDIYHSRVKMFHVKDAEFRPTGRQGVYGGYQPWVERAGRFRSLGDGQVDFRGIFSKLAQYGFDGWAVLEWECCLKSSEQGAREGAPFIKRHIIEIAERMDDRYELVAAALSSDPGKSLAAAEALHIPRAYGRFEEMAAAEAARPDGIEAVSIVTPNHMHYANAKTFLDAGIHVICDKPLTTTLEAALDLAKIVERTGLIFGLTHNYTGYPMVRQAREMVLAGELGAIRIIQVEYAQDWLSTPLEKTGQKQAEWRTDPARSGPGGSLGDIGTHAFNLACFVTGLSCQEIAAEVTTFVPGRRLDDNVQLLLRFSKGAKGTLWASQVAAGNENNLRLRVYGEKAGLEWQQENPNELVFAPLGQPRRILRRGGPGAGAAAARAIRIPAGHPEGYLEAFAQLYKDLAEQITAKREGGSPDPQSLLVPGIADGVEGMRFISAVLESSRNRSAWTALSGSR